MDVSTFGTLINIYIFLYKYLSPHCFSVFWWAVPPLLRRPPLDWIFYWCRPHSGMIRTIRPTPGTTAAGYHPVLLQEGSAPSLVQGPTKIHTIYNHLVQVKFFQTVQDNAYIHVIILLSSGC